MTARLSAPAGYALMGLVWIAMGLALASSRSSLLLVLLLLIGVATATVAGLRQPERAALVLVGLITAYPVARIVVQGVPVYVADIVALVALIGLVLHGPRLSGYGKAVLVYLFLWVPALLHEITSLGIILAPLYGFMRDSLAVLVFFLGFALARRLDGAERFVTIAAAGTLVTSALAVAQEAGPASGAVRHLLLILAPDFTPGAYHSYPNRAFGLFAAATILSCFLGVMIALLIGSLPALSPRRQILAGSAAAAAVAAEIATASRQWLPAVALALVVLAIVRVGIIARLFVLGSVTLAVIWLLAAHGALDSSYAQQRFERLGRDDVNVQTRLARQREFFSTAYERPITTVIGHGFAGQDIVSRALVTENAAQELRVGVNDNSFLLEVFNHGLGAGVLYVVLAFVALARVLAASAWQGDRGVYASAVASALSAAILLHLFDRTFSEAIFMKAFFWLLVGLAVGTVSGRDPREPAQ
jgi:hypothetical protein